MNKGIKKLTRAVIEKARSRQWPNASKDKPSGKEDRALKDGNYFFFHGDEDIAAVVPNKLVPGRNPRFPVSLPMSERRRKLLQKRVSGTQGYRAS